MMMRELIDYLEIAEGITTVIGSGGKTSLMKRLSEELKDDEAITCDASVILTTSTHIVAYDNMALYTGKNVNELRELVKHEGVVCTGTPDGFKLASPAVSFDDMADIADYVIVEGDGSNKLPLKAHAGFEPVIPNNTNQVILVVGASGWDRKIGDAVHRPELFSAQGTVFSFSGEMVSPERYAEFVAYELREGIIEIPDNAMLKIFINQIDTHDEMPKARRFANQFRNVQAEALQRQEIPIIAGTLHNNKYELI